jgi:hypothetical protein
MNLCAFVCLLLTQTPAPATLPPGQRIDLAGEATLFVPATYKPSGGVVNIVLHMHGAASVIEPALVEVGWTAVLIEFNRKGLSSVYTRPFADPALFPRLLDRTLAALEEQKIVQKPKVGRVLVSSFSAGFGGVRELLKVPENFNRIDAIVLADSLYCGYTGDPKDHKVDPALMADFRRFAREAAAGKKSLVLSHSAQVPEGYASTTETANDLITCLGGESLPFDAAWGKGLTPKRKFAKGNVLIFGFMGTEAADHMNHLRGISTFWKIVPGWVAASEF